ncbi:MAG: putative acetyltransferase [Ilumatobacteraceae bacterium]|jgi:RimJ/RimL family protein N-acetyltransferase|nr:putative acetyltransferase [Ilumatobacteraceae bacterium]
MSLPSPTLTGRHVQLEQVRPEHAAELVAAANENRSTYAWTAVPATEPEMREYIAGSLREQEERTMVPFVQRRLADGVLVGCTRYLRLEWWAGPDLPAEVEVGGTWLAASAQRTPINTEAKLLLFQHAFEVYGVHRVAICTDVRNERSRAAILRVGATFEGVLRSHRGAYVVGEGARDSAMHSVIAGEWPGVKAMLLAKLATSG